MSSSMTWDTSSISTYKKGERENSRFLSRTNVLNVLKDFKNEYPYLFNTVLMAFGMPTQPSKTCPKHLVSSCFFFGEKQP